MSTASTAMESLIDRFRRMVARDGGELTVLAVTPGDVRLRYRAAAADPDCADGICVMPHRELEQMITETLARQWPGVRVHVELEPAHDTPKQEAQ
jgi:Fe-S cluster biogenesis protein NfuA